MGTGNIETHERALASAGCVAVLLAFAAAWLPSLPSTAQTVLSLSFEQAEWTNAAGQAIDSGPFGLHGTPFGDADTADTSAAAPGDPGTCRYGVFDGDNEYVEVADNAALDITAELTVAAWIYLRTTPTELYTIASKDTNYEYHIDSQRRLYWWWNDSVGNTRSLTTTTQINLNQWHHVAITYASGEQRMYIDGVLQGVSGTFAGSLATNDLPFYAGTDWNFISRAFDGYIDEVRVIAAALAPAEIETLRADTHPCAPVRFTITSNPFGIHCVDQTITVGVIDTLTGTPVLNYNTAVQLDTRSGFGSWSLVAGGGTFADVTPDDGIATYAWPLGQSQATFALGYRQGPPSIDVDVFQVSNPGVSDVDPQGVIAFSPNGFTVTAQQLTNPPPGVISPFASHQTAGASFALHIAAFGQTDTDPTCGVIEEYTDAKNLKFWSQYVNPGSGARNVTIGGAPAAPVEAAAADQQVAFVQGRAVVTAKYKDVGRIRIFMKDDTTVNAGLPGGIRGATADFVVRPAGFTLSDVAVGALANPQAANASGTVFAAAGASFRMTVTARDAEGDATPNYGRETPREGVRLPTEIELPVGGASPAIGWTAGFGDFSGGVATGTDFTWSEVGVTRAVPGVGDGDYLEAGDVSGPPSEPIGRFIPDHFVATLDAPSPMFTTACAAGGFTYQGQPFGYATPPVIVATAVAVNGATTLNYTGDFFKLAPDTLTGRSYTSPAAALDTSGLPPTTADPVITSPSGGVARLTFGSGSGLAFVKGAPQEPFDAQISLAINIVDADGVAAVGAAPFGNPVTVGGASGIPFTTSDEIRYGRVRVGTAVGSELVDLPVPMRTEYFAPGGAGFVTNVADVCTTDDVSLAFLGYTKSLNAGETCVRDGGAPGASGMGCAAAAGSPYREPPLAGDFNLQLAAPGAGNQGSVAIRASVPEWLKFDWDAGAAGDEDPAGQATFGIFGGERRVIYTREIY